MTPKTVSWVSVAVLIVIILSGLLFGIVSGKEPETGSKTRLGQPFQDLGPQQTIPPDDPKGARPQPPLGESPTIPPSPPPIPALTPGPASPADYGSRSGLGSLLPQQSFADSPSDVSCPLVDGFDSVPGAGWVILNLSSPLGSYSWYQGNTTVFSAHSGAATSYAATNYSSTSGAGTISDWLIAPSMTFQNGDMVTFYTRTVTGSAYPDRLQLRLSVSGSGINIPGDPFAVGDFSILLVDINPAYAVGGYPETWTEYRVIIGGLHGPTVGRLAFRYFVEDGGSGGARSNYIGVDSFSVCRDSTKATQYCKYIEGYDTMIPPAWVVTNLSDPIGSLSWYQGVNTVFPAHSGAATSYAASNYNSTAGSGTISDWLISPEIVFSDNDVIKFYTRVPQDSNYPDRLEVRLSTNLNSAWAGVDALSHGDFSILLLVINPTLAVGGYPETWTPYTIALNGLGDYQGGRLAFRYFVTDGGPSGSNSNYIGVDTFSVCSYSVFLPAVNR